MKQLVRTIGVVCAALAVTALQPSAQAVSIQAEMLKDWVGLKDTMDKIASAMPDDKFTFKSTPAQRDYGQQVLHIAQINVRLLQTVGAKAAPPKLDPAATGKAATIKAMDDSFDYGTAILKEHTDQTLVQAAAMAPGFLGPSTRARMFTFLIGHAWDFYGQMAVYLRLNGIVPPASERP